MKHFVDGRAKTIFKFPFSLTFLLSSPLFLKYRLNTHSYLSYMVLFFPPNLSSRLSLSFSISINLIFLNNYPCFLISLSHCFVFLQSRFVYFFFIWSFIYFFLKTSRLFILDPCFSRHFSLAFFALSNMCFPHFPLHFPLNINGCQMLLQKLTTSQRQIY